MQGTIQKEKCGFQWMRIGYAGTRFRIILYAVFLPIILVLAVWAYRELPDTSWRWIHFLALYLAAGILYANFGVWLHEQLHYRAFRGTAHEHNTQVHYERKFLLTLSGHYKVRGGISCRIMQRALLAPIQMSVGLVIVGWLGSLVFPGWWFPILLTLAAAGVMDMVHDLYMVRQIRLIGDRAKFWDRGHYLDAVWKDPQL